MSPSVMGVSQAVERVDVPLVEEQVRGLEHVAAGRRERVAESRIDGEERFERLVHRDGLNLNAPRTIGVVPQHLGNADGDGGHQAAAVWLAGAFSERRAVCGNAAERLSAARACAYDWGDPSAQ